MSTIRNTTNVAAARKASRTQTQHEVCQERASVAQFRNLSEFYDKLIPVTYILKVPTEQSAIQLAVKMKLLPDRIRDGQSAGSLVVNHLPILKSLLSQ